MIEIDGGKGGGQILRTALSLSAIQNKAFRMENIRGSRSNPGLSHQHLECVKAVAKLCGAEMEGAELGSQELVFEPESLENKSLRSDIGTAGSVMLLIDTILPITTQFDSSFSFTALGGTDVRWSPVFDYCNHVKLPMLRKFGFKGDLELGKTGYYPSGNGKVTLNTEEYAIDPVVVEGRGSLQRFEIYSKASLELRREEVANRQANELEKLLNDSEFSVEVDKNVSYERTDSEGSTLVLKAVYNDSVAGFDIIGDNGSRIEEVAEELFGKFKDFHSTNAAVESRMADQLMIFAALTEGKLPVPQITSHIATNREVLKSFGFDSTIEVEEDKKVIEFG